MEHLMDFLIYAVPSGFLGSIVTWVVNRNRQNNDMLKELQSSINMLSEENRKMLQENVQLRKENAGLKVNQEEMILQMARLTKEVERLRKVINKQTIKDEKSNPRENPHSNHVRTAPDRLCGSENQQDGTVESTGTTGQSKSRVRSVRTAVHSNGSEDVGGIGGVEEDFTGGGCGSGVTGESGCSDTEPP